jgi:hypothetical protein
MRSSARYASAGNVVCRDDDVFGARNVLLKRVLYYAIIVTIIELLNRIIIIVLSKYL